MGNVQPIDVLTGLTTVSLVGCAIIFAGFALYKEVRESTLNRIVFMMTVADVFVNVGLLLGPVMMAHPATCTVQGAVLQFGAGASATFLLMMAFYVAHQFLIGATEAAFTKWFSTWVAVAFIGSLFVATIIMTTPDVYGPAGAWCWVRAEYPEVRFAIFLLPESLFGLFGLGVLGSVAWQARRRPEVMKDAHIGQALTYCAVLNVLVWIKLVLRTMDAIEPDHELTALRWMVIVAVPLKYGIFNSLLFSTSSVVVDGTMSAFLNVSGGTAAFMRFLRNEFSDENLEFLLYAAYYRTGKEPEAMHVVDALRDLGAEGGGTFGLPRQSPGRLSAPAAKAAADGKRQRGAAASAKSRRDTSATPGSAASAATKSELVPRERPTAPFIVDRFIKPDAGRQVNVPDPMRRSCLLSAATDTNYSAFEECAEEIFNLIERDSFRRFAATATYAEFLADVKRAEAVPKGRHLLVDMAVRASVAVAAFCARFDVCGEAPARYASRRRGSAMPLGHFAVDDGASQLQSVSLVVNDGAAARGADGVEMATRSSTRSAPSADAGAPATASQGTGYAELREVVVKFR